MTQEEIEAAESRHNEEAAEQAYAEHREAEIKALREQRDGLLSICEEYLALYRNGVFGHGEAQRVLFDEAREEVKRVVSWEHSRRAGHDAF